MAVTWTPVADDEDIDNRNTKKSQIQWEPIPNEPKPSGLMRRSLGDLGVSLAKGVAVGIPETVVGLVDIPTLGLVGKGVDTAAKFVGAPTMKEAGEWFEKQYSPETQAARAEVSKAEGVLPTLKAAVTNPSALMTYAGENIPTMLGGGAISRGLLKAAPKTFAKMGEKTAPIIAGAAGEAIVTAGQNVEQVREAEKNGLLSPTQVALNTGSGILTGLISAGAGKIAAKLGIYDPQTLMAGGGLAAPVSVAQREAKKGVIGKVLKSMAQEGLLEELPQSWQEAIAQNISQGKPWDEGIANQAVTGALVGGIIGGGAAVVGHRASKLQAQLETDKLNAQTETYMKEMQEEYAAIQPPVTPAWANEPLPSDLQTPAYLRNGPPQLPAGQGFETIGEPFNPTERILQEAAPTTMALPPGGQQNFTMEEIRPETIRRPAYNIGTEPSNVPVEYTTQIQKNGKPYKTEAMAELAAMNKKIPADQFEVVKVKDGYGYKRVGRVIGETKTAIDQASHEAASSPLNSVPEPTPAQIDAGNYKKGHILLQGLDISIENPQGSERKGTSSDGKQWLQTMQDHYGYIKGTKGKDKDHIDTFIGPNPESQNVFVVNQQNPKTNKFDEHKIMIGYQSQEEAIQAYQRNYEPGWKGLKNIVPMRMDQFKKWIKEGNTKIEASAKTTPNPPSPTPSPTGIVQPGANKAVTSVTAPTIPLTDEQFKAIGDKLGLKYEGTFDRSRSNLPPLPQYSDPLTHDTFGFQAEKGENLYDEFVKIRQKWGKELPVNPVDIAAKEPYNISQIYQAIKANPGGFTLNVSDGAMQTKGFAVAPAKETETILDQVTKDDLRSFLYKFQSVFDSDNRAFLGGWHNDATGKDVLDISFVTDTIEDAVYLAELGEQDAIYDLNGQREITTADGISELKQSGVYSESRRDALRSIRGILREKIRGGRDNQASATEAATVTEGSGRERLDNVPEGGRSTYGSHENTPGAISFTAIHYSKEPREVISTSFYGTNKAGEEKIRLPDDKASPLWKRSFFYGNTGYGINPEPGVGIYPHRVVLDGIYDARSNSLDIPIEPDQNYNNAMEEALLAAGYIGWFDRASGVGCVIGDHNIPVEQLDPKANLSDTPVLPPRKLSELEAVQESLNKNTDIYQGQVEGPRWIDNLKENAPELYSRLDKLGVIDKLNYITDNLSRRDLTSILKSQRGSISVMPDSLAKELEGLRNNIKLAMPKLIELGQNVYTSGATKLSSWRDGMKTALGNMWESFRSAMGQVWNTMKKVISNERGAIEISAGKPMKPAPIAKSASEIAKDMAAHPINTTRSVIADSYGKVEESLGIDFEYKFIDRFKDLRNAVKVVEAFGNKLRDAINPSLKQILYSSRVAAKIDDGKLKEFVPLYKAMVANGITDRSEIETYLHNRHAIEANEYIRSLIERDEDGNPVLDDEGNEIKLGLQDGGSGILDADAKSYMAKVEGTALGKKYEKIAKMVDKITQENLRLMVDEYQLEDQDTIDKWRKTYPNWVPLFRDHIEDGFIGIGNGFSVAGPTSQRRTGSLSPVVNILANIEAQREKIIQRGEKSMVGRALYQTAVENPGNVVKEKTSTKTGKVTQQHEFWDTYKINRLSAFVARGVRSTIKDNVMAVRMPDPETGKVSNFAIEFNESNPEAIRLCKTLKNMDMDTLGLALTVSSKITRWIASVNTQYNPMFGITNFVRDIGFSMLSLENTPLKGRQWEVMKHASENVLKIFKAVREERQGITPTSNIGKQFKQFQMGGGQTGYRDIFKTTSSRSNAIDRELRVLMSGNKVLKGGYAIKNLLTDYNTAMENAVRLAVYQTATTKDSKGKQAMSNEQALAAAKGITVNFDRKGQAATQLGAAYAFFNASIQGASKVVEVMLGPSGKKIIYGGIMLGVLQAAMMSAAGMGEDEPPQWDQEKNFIIPIPSGDKNYIKIPMPLGFNVLPNIGRITAQYALSGFKKPFDRGAHMLSVIADAFNPLGSTKSLLQTILPTPLDPFVAISENKDWTGKAIFREDYNKLRPTPGFTRARETASFSGMALAKVFNAITGGDKYTPGLYSPTPEEIDYLANQAMGGIGREITKTERVIKGLSQGEEVPPYMVPLIGRFYGKASGEASETSNYYTNIKKMNMHEAEITGLRKDRKPIAEYIHDNPEAKYWRYAKSTQADIAKLNKRRQALLDHGHKEAARTINSLIKRRMAKFNEVVEKAA